MKKLSRHKLVQQLKQEGLNFSELALSSEGEYAADDADWNYKDVPHLHHVHELAEAYPALMGDDVICSVNMQKILGLWYPIALVNYEYEKYKQVYFTTLFFFVLVIETITEELEPIKTRVTTTYSIGYPKWLFWAVPVLKALIKRNYKVLMAADIPMRDRRGELRKLGYGFYKATDSYTFEATTEILKSNVQLPANANRTSAFNYVQAFGNGSEAFVGDIGLLGLRMQREGDEVTVWPRACPHEGASLDRSPCKDGRLKCEWHGRMIKPIGKFNWLEAKSFSSENYAVSVAGEQLTVEYRS